MKSGTVHSRSTFSVTALIGFAVVLQVCQVGDAWGQGGFRYGRFGRTSIYGDKPLGALTQQFNNPDPFDNSLTQKPAVQALPITTSNRQNTAEQRFYQLVGKLKRDFPPGSVIEFADRPGELYLVVHYFLQEYGQSGQANGARVTLQNLTRKPANQPT
jgi:hypothetical protein